MFGSIADIEGYNYETVLIGDQWWMAENLRTSRFSDGSIILNVTDSAAWSQLITPACCFYDNSPAYGALYGKLYNWYTTVDPRNLCPTGWHVPLDAEWTILTNYLGGLAVSGGKMKSTTGWNSPNTAATNESGFTALPAGSRGYDEAIFYGVGGLINFWTSSENTSDAWLLGIGYNGGNAGFATISKMWGFSVRCLRD